MRRPAETGQHVVDVAARREAWRAAAVLVGWWLLLGAANFIWLKRDTRPPTWDPAVHLTSSVRYRHFLQDFLRGRSSLDRTLEGLVGVDAFYPPLAPLVGALLSLRLPPEPDSSTWLMNQFFLGVLMLGTYGLGRRLTGPAAGLAAAVAVTSFGGVLQASHLFMLDLPMAAMTAVALECLLATDRFASARRSLLLGILCGLGMLTKWMFLFYIAVPFGVEALAAATLPDRLRRFRNASLCLTVAALITLSWYLFHAPNLIRESLTFGFHSWEGFPPVWSAWGLTFYARVLPSLLLLPWFAVLVVGGLPSLWRRRELRRFALLSLSGLLLLSLVRNKNARYATSALPGLAVIATAWVGEKRQRARLQWAAVSALAVGSVALALRQDPPVAEHWPIAETLDAALAPPSSRRPCVRVIPDIPPFQRFVFAYAAEAQGISADVEGGSGFPTFTDAVIVKTGDQGPRPDAQEIMATVAQNGSGFHETFQKSWEDPLPDGSRVEVYRRGVQPVRGIAPQQMVERVQKAIGRQIERELHAPFAGRVELELLSDDETLRGHFRRVMISARDQRIGGKPDEPGLRVREIACVLGNVTINPYALDGERELEVLSLDELTPHVQLSEEDVNAWLDPPQRATGIRVAFQNGAIRARATRARMPSIEIVARPEIVENQNLRLRWEGLRVAHVPVPTFLLAALMSAYNPILKEMPCRIRITQLRCERGEWTINDLEESGGEELQSASTSQRNR